MSELHVTPEFGLINHIRALDERVGRLEMAVFPPKSSGIDGDAGDWTAAGQDKDGFPVAKGSPEDVTHPEVQDVRNEDNQPGQ